MDGVEYTLCTTILVDQKASPMQSKHKVSYGALSIDVGMWAVNVISSTYDLENLVFPAR